MKKITTIIICGLILPLWILAQQAEDVVVIDGKSHYVRADPLYRYLSNMSQRKLLDDYIDNFCEPYWPNYTRYWEIKNRLLYLVKIETDNKEVEYPLNLLFPGYDGTPVKATWYSGILSYRSGDSPVILLNREYYEEEEVVRLVNGIVHETFKMDHRDRWISYSRRLMDQYRPLGDDLPEASAAASDSEEGMVVTNVVPVSKRSMVEFLEYAFSVVTHPKDKPSIYFPVIQIKFNADLEGLQLTEAHKELASSDLLKAIAKETGNVLDVTVSNRLVIYEIREDDSVEPDSVAPRVTDHVKSETPPE
jgi:hypothetical protein